MPVKIKGMTELLARVRSLERDLARPASFYAANRESYHRQAVEIAVRILTALRPPEVDSREWTRRVSLVADRVSTDLSIFGNGIIFSVTVPPQDATGNLSPADDRPTSEAMSFDDIRDWIQAGLDGKPGGKRITATDRARIQRYGVNAVASIVMKAYYSSTPEASYTRMRKVIQRYMLGARAEESSPLLDSVRTAWTAHFATVIPKDLREWTAARVSAF